jgi:PIN domain nuclease of toxin-antitoxin system
MDAEESDFEEDARGYSSNRYLLDTSIILWLTAEPERLSDAASAIWRDPNRMIAVSLINYWEIAWLWDDRISSYVDLETLPVREEHIAELSLLPQLHKDPFDRMLIAQARVENMILVTPDKMVQKYEVRTIW